MRALSRRLASENKELLARVRAKRSSEADRSFLHAQECSELLELLLVAPEGVVEHEAECTPQVASHPCLQSSWNLRYLGMIVDLPEQRLRHSPTKSAVKPPHLMMIQKPHILDTFLQVEVCRRINESQKHTIPKLGVHPGMHFRLMTRYEHQFFYRRSECGAGSCFVLTILQPPSATQDFYVFATNLAPEVENGENLLDREGRRGLCKQSLQIGQILGHDVVPMKRFLFCIRLSTGRYKLAF